MLKFICTTCGVQYPYSIRPPELCIICTEERQYVNPAGQTWTTLDDMRSSEKYENEIVKMEEGLHRITTKPEFGIGQSAFLVQESGFNVLWDCITFLDEETEKKIRELGGIDAIALSHPHYYSTQAEWAKSFDVPIYIHEDDMQWVTEPSDRIVFWKGDQYKLAEGLVLHRLGGHFKGGAVLHWPYGNSGKGILLSGDIIQVVADTNWVSFMYSYPNLIPLPASKVKDIAERVKELHFDRLYNAFQKVVKENAGEAVQNSAIRYVSALEGTLFHS
ncbi:MBL fold metallo-hydrolase [Siminovitchia acidinfaciens]|uniref:MBL fold metallo-hydrolase n=1 Tax=Siminovitchia acidinfaciens TaxID=2321395 RepID=A0A429XWH1_9BACI|nr:MBL fold metallo-hydrolase [Siminovitchia acidinfaciens]RST72731.1 MBL fold metallo-hydrolase [Siminovitchia acidinfaciens]